SVRMCPANLGPYSRAVKRLLRAANAPAAMSPAITKGMMTESRVPPTIGPRMRAAIAAKAAHVHRTFSEVDIGFRVPMWCSSFCLLFHVSVGVCRFSGSPAPHPCPGGLCSALGRIAALVVVLAALVVVLAVLVVVLAVLVLLG